MGNIPRFVLGLIAFALWTPMAGFIAYIGFRDWAMRSWSRLALWTVNMRIKVVGQLPPPGSLVVMNHSSYLDIFVIGAVAQGSFVAKGEIEGWPLMGWSAAAARTIFVDRKSKRQSRDMAEKTSKVMVGGDRALVFAEGGILNDGKRIESFRPMFFEAGVVAGSPVVPTAIRYLDDDDPRVWAWSREPVTSRSVVSAALAAGPAQVVLHFGPELMPGPDNGRKKLADASHAAVCRMWEEAGAGGETLTELHDSQGGCLDGIA